MSFSLAGSSSGGGIAESASARRSTTPHIRSMLTSARQIARLSRSQCLKHGLEASAVNKIMTPRIPLPGMLDDYAQQASKTPALLHSRAFAISAMPDSVPTLLDTVREELEYEQSTDTAQAEKIPQPPKDWTVTQEQGGSTISLARTYKNEQIIVVTDIKPLAEDAFPFDDALEGAADEEEKLEQDLVEGDGDAEDFDPNLSLSFGVEIIKAGEKLRFKASFDGELVEILHVSYGEDKAGVYDGPEYSDLDPNLQQAFVAHLEERGVDSALGEYLMNAHDSKEQSEYLVWLSKLEKFLSKK